MTGYEVNNFCYPAGDFNDSVPAYLQKYGYLTAVTTAPGFVDQYSNPYELKRLNAAFDFNLFKAMVSGSLHILLKLNYFVRRR
jgi:peptidoglycan/xylan/chitin deacetylase (PgdA/CDA1 family)